MPTVWNDEPEFPQSDNSGLIEKWPTSPQVTIMHDVRITKHQSSMATVIQCVNCPEKDTEADYEWHDEDGTVYFTGNSVEDLMRFLIVHPTREQEFCTPPF